MVTRATFLTTCYVPPSPHVKCRTQKTEQRPHQIFINLRPSRLIMSMSFVSFLFSSLETLPAGGLPSLFSIEEMRGIRRHENKSRPCAGILQKKSSQDIFSAKLISIEGSHLN